MYYISHRGNLSGSQPEFENKPAYIVEALNKGFDVEIDVWFKNGSFWLGHDEPTYRIYYSFLQNKKLWCHAKNIKALNEMLKIKNIHCFWHEEDTVTLTSKGYIWTYPEKDLTDKSICVLPNSNSATQSYIGICSDYIERYKLND